jgi:DNA ligase (NAD+)
MCRDGFMNRRRLNDDGRTRESPAYEWLTAGEQARMDERSRMDERARLLSLQAELTRHAWLYQVMDAPEIDDSTYDGMMRELRILEAAHPDLATPDSPSQRVGGRPSGDFGKVAHQVRMESLNDVFGQDAVTAFDARVREIVSDDVDYVVERKVDGLSVSLEYENGLFVRALPAETAMSEKT